MIESLVYVNLRRQKIIGLILLILMSGTLYGLGIYNKITEKPLDTSIRNLPYIKLKPDFTLPSINGDNYTFSNDAGLIRIVNFFYTKCPGDDGCSLVTLKLSRLYSDIRQAGYKDKVRFISIDFDTINDTMDDLRSYAKQYVIDNDTQRWQFLLGSTSQTKNVAEAWGFDFGVNNDTTKLSLSIDSSDDTDPYYHTFLVYIVDQNGWDRYELLGNSWLNEKAFEVIEFLINNPK